MKGNIELSVLDEYAKALTPTQTKMLFEKKTKQNFEEHLNEKFNEEGKLRLYLDNFTLAKNGISQMKFISENSKNMEIKESMSGVYLYTKSKKTYIDACKSLKEYGLPKEDILESVDYSYRGYLNEIL